MENLDWNRLSSGKPDLILLDMSMPQMTGMEMLAALRQTELRLSGHLHDILWI